MEREPQEIPNQIKTNEDETPLEESEVQEETSGEELLDEEDWIIATFRPSAKNLGS